MLKSFLLSMGVTMSLFGQIHEIQSIKEVRKHLPKEEKPLCIFDVDYTLTMPQDPRGQLPNILKYRHIYKDLYKGISEDQANLVRVHLVGDGESVLIEDSAVELIQELKDKGCPVMAFTASTRYHKGDGSWRAKRLKRLGVDFETGAADIAPDSEVFNGGVLFGNFEKLKGPPLIKFLDTAHVKPNMVIAVDDKEVHLKSMEEELNALGIDFIGLVYRGSRHYPSEEVTEESFIQFYKDLRDVVEG